MLYTTILLSIIILVIMYKENFVIKQRYDPMLLGIKNSLIPIIPDINSIDIRSDRESYTLNKSRIHLCMKHKETGEYYDRNFLIYVLLHEIAHLKNHRDVGHTPTFYNIFNELLTGANKLGIWDPKKPLLKSYCGRNY